MQKGAETQHTLGERKRPNGMKEETWEKLQKLRELQNASIQPNQGLSRRKRKHSARLDHKKEPERGCLKLVDPFLRFRDVPDGKLAAKNEIEIQIEQAITAGRFDEANKLNNELIKNDMNELVDKTKSVLEQQKHLEESKKSKKKRPRLQWGFNAKERWERKGHM